MLSSPYVALGTPRSSRTRRVTTVNCAERASAAPCLGLALGLDGLLWVGIGSAAALILHLA